MANWAYSTRLHALLRSKIHLAKLQHRSSQLQSLRYLQSTEPQLVCLRTTTCGCLLIMAIPSFSFGLKVSQVTSFDPASMLQNTSLHQKFAKSLVVVTPYALSQVPEKFSQ